MHIHNWEAQKQNFHVLWGEKRGDCQQNNASSTENADNKWIQSATIKMRHGAKIRKMSLDRAERRGRTRDEGSKFLVFYVLIVKNQRNNFCLWNPTVVQQHKLFSCPQHCQTFMWKKNESEPQTTKAESVFIIQSQQNSNGKYRKKKTRQFSEIFPSVFTNDEFSCCCFSTPCGCSSLS